MFNLDYKGRKIKKEISKLLYEVPELPQVDKNNIIMFLENGEWGMAFDSLCSQIYENDIGITEDFYKEVEMIASKMKIDSTEWAFLKELIR